MLSVYCKENGLLHSLVKVTKRYSIKTYALQFDVVLCNLFVLVAIVIENLAPSF